MAPRLNKRQQRELEELDNLGAGSAGGLDKEEASSEEEAVPVQKASAFSNLLAAQDGEDENDDDDAEEEGSVKPSSKSRKKKKKKKGTASTTEPATPAVATPPPEPVPAKEARDSVAAAASKAEKKAAKKARAKEKKAGGDEIEQALAELSVKYPDLQKPGSTSSAASSSTFTSLLSVSLSHLDAEAEMRKFFGSKVISANKSGSSKTAVGGRRGGAGAAQRSNLTKPQPSWWSASQREGLSIRLLTSEEAEKKRAAHKWNDRYEVTDEKLWTVEYSQGYKSMTKGFIAAVMTGHPEALFEIQRRLPWHADNLLQMAEIYRHREEHAQAVDFVDRAIFTYERAFIGAFTFTSGVNRLDFDRVENRPFFLAVHRQISDLQRRGCVRTAFEFARLLYSLDPWVDPHGAVHHLEILALKAGMSQWLLDLFDYSSKRSEGRQKQDARLNPSILPGFMYARALAMKILEDGKGDSDHEQSTAALKEAMASFPSIIPLLADKIDVTLPASLASHSALRIETDARSLSEHVGVLHLLSHMYALRSSGIWKESDHSKWFSTTVQSISLPSRSTTPQHQTFLALVSSDENTRWSIYRHVVVLESTHKRLFSFIPAQILSQAKSSLACDPLPPPPSTLISSYDAAYFSNVPDLPTLQPRLTRGQRRQQAALDARMLAQMIPNAEARRQLEDMIQGDEQLRQQFPGGLREVLERFGVDGLEDMMVAGAAGGIGGEVAVGMGAMIEPGDEMPGGFEGDMRELGEEGEDDDEEEEDEDASLLPRIIRNFVGRLWGGPAQPDESSDEEDDNIHRPGGDDNDVD